MSVVKVSVMEPIPVPVNTNENPVTNVSVPQYHVLPALDSVTSVNGMVGDVVLTAHDVNAYTQEETDEKIEMKIGSIAVLLDTV